MIRNPAQIVRDFCCKANTAEKSAVFIFWVLPLHDVLVNRLGLIPEE